MPALELDHLIDLAVTQNASDLHFQCGERPWLRVHGSLKPLEHEVVADETGITRILAATLDPAQRKRLDAERALDFGHRDAKGGRWRCHAFFQASGLALAMRRLSPHIPVVSELRLPAAVEKLAHLRSGLVLFVGASGSGKTTSMAALLGLINRSSRRQIITIEDPIEYVHEDDQCLIHQREVGQHVASFEAGVADALVQGPDVLVVGELREYQTIRLALSAAETGVLVIATLHTNNAIDAIHRIIDVFPPDEQPLARAMLAMSLEGVVAQALLVERGGRGRVPAVELIFGTPALSALIREGKIHEVPSVIQTGRGLGMCLIDDSLHDLVADNLITREQAQRFARNPERFGQAY